MRSVTVPAGVLERARRTLTAAGRLDDTAAGRLDDTAAEVLVGGRAALLGLRAGGRVSAGGATRLLSDGRSWCALTLSRPDDVDAVPALVEAESVPADPWPAVAGAVRQSGVERFAERARLLGLPVGVLGETTPSQPAVVRLGERTPPPPLTRSLVVDLSSMWAGPLCGHLLARAGAMVVKVESPSRPDGTRAGPAAFFDWMNGGKLSYVGDLASRTVRDLLAVADIVIESSRPAALQRLRRGPRDVPARPGRVWLQITGHGGDHADRVAFGDDAAVAGGLVGGTAAGPVFCGDAIADPLTGIEALAAVLRARARGGGEVVTLSMAAVAAGYASARRGPEIPCSTAPVIDRPGPRPGADNAVVSRLVAQRWAPC